MHIAIDIREAQSDKTGKGWYTFNLVNELLKIDHNSQYTLYGNSKINPFGDFKNVILKNIDKHGLRWHFAILKDLKKTKPNCFFSPVSYIIPAFAPKSLPVIITVHDLVSFLFPSNHNLKAVIIERFTLGRAVKHAQKIFTVSKNTRRDLINHSNYPQKNILITPCAPSDLFKHKTGQKELDQFRQKLKLPQKFILSVGTIEPRKNLVTLIKSFSIIKKRFPQYRLVIVGKKGWKYNQVEMAIQRYHLKNDVIFTGYLESADLKKMYDLAAIFVFPSLYEGFGIPPLEAMACGVPVVSSNIASMPEVIGDCGILIDPKNAFRMANAIMDLLENEHARKIFVERGKKRAATFTWQKSAKIALDAFKNVYSNR